MSRALRAAIAPPLGCEYGAKGTVIGRDPRKMTRAELEAVEHKPMSPLKALRLKCLDCCCGSPRDVRSCVAVDCPSWPFRMGKSPWREPRKLSDEQRAQMAARLRRLRSASVPERG